MIHYYEDKGKLPVLEKIIQHLDFTEYSRRDELILICQTHYLVSALLYLMTSTSDSQGVEDMGCMQVLNTMFKLLGS